MVLAHGANEEATPPGCKLRPGVDDHPAGGNSRSPNPNRLLHAFMRCDTHADGSAGILPTIRDHRPAVVCAAMNQVEFVAAQRTMLVRPQLSSYGVHNQALRIAMSVAPDLRLRILGANERIVGRNAAIIAQAKNLTRVIVELLRPVLVMALANRQEQITIEENHPSAVVEAIFRECVGGENALAVDHFVVAEAEAVHHGCAALAGAGRIAEIDPTIFQVLGMECDVVKSSILTGQGGGTVGVVNAGVGADQSFGSAF